jgi:hypothetical protein|tara:strand:+ start:33 stop:161 length:129 start_codon:yes stop_codon:yes gene_type:complete
MEDIMDKVKQEAKRIWKLAIANKKVTIGIVIVVVILFHLINK